MVVLSALLVLLPNAHAHNDYAHPRPLLDALDQGFLSVEVDVFLVDGEFRVGHTKVETRPGRTIESLYLDPLARRVRANRGTVYDRPGTLTLLVDLKEDGARLEPEFVRHLTPYRSMLIRRSASSSSETRARRGEGAVKTGAVRIVLSGARTAGCAARADFLFKDGRIEDLDDPAAETPWISGEYGRSLGSPSAPLPGAARAKLDALVGDVHRKGKRLRLWGAPDTSAAWGELADAGVDLINTDRLADLRAFLLRRAG